MQEISTKIRYRWAMVADRFTTLPDSPERITAFVVQLCRLVEFVDYFAETENEHMFGQRLKDLLHARDREAAMREFLLLGR